MTDDPGHAQDSHQRQLNEYFSAWMRALQQAAGPGPATGGGSDGFAAAAGGPWLQAIHQLARQALEQELDSAGIAAAWRQILQQGLWPDVVPISGLFSNVQGPWSQAGSEWLAHPAFGPMREHLQRWQQLARQQQLSQSEWANWQGLLNTLREQALQQFESLLRAHEQRPLADARALLDLWVEAAESAWQQVAMSEEFARLLAQLNQTQMQQLQAQQGEAERVYAALGIASRRELDQAYQRIDALERQVRQLLATQTAPAAGGKPRTASAAKAARARPAPGGKAAPDSAAPAKGRAKKSVAAAAKTPAGNKAASTTANKRTTSRNGKG